MISIFEDSGCFSVETGEYRSEWVIETVDANERAESVMCAFLEWADIKCIRTDRHEWKLSLLKDDSKRYTTNELLSYFIEKHLTQ